jgi:hypothetical protein
MVIVLIMVMVTAVKGGGLLWKLHKVLVVNVLVG